MTRTKKIVLAVVVLIVALFVGINIPERKKETKTEHFVFRYSRSINPVKINSLATALESNYLRISKDLNTIPAGKIEVNVYAHRWRYIKATGNWTASGSIEGISTLHFIEHASGESNIEKVAIHEFTHAIVLKLLLDLEQPTADPNDFNQKFNSFPVWLWEALSTYEAGQFIDPQKLNYLNNGQYPSLSELNSRSNSKIYDCGYTIIEYILVTFKHDKLMQLIKSYGDLKNVFNITAEQFSKGWYDFIKQKYLK